MNQTTRDLVWSTLLSCNGEVKLSELTKACNVTRKTASEVMHVAAGEDFVEYESLNPLKVRVIE